MSEKGTCEGCNKPIDLESEEVVLAYTRRYYCCVDCAVNHLPPREAA